MASSTPAASSSSSAPHSAPILAQGDWTKNLVYLAKTAELKYVHILHASSPNSSLLRCLVATSLDHSCNFTPVDWCAESGRDSYVFTPKFVYFQSEGPAPIRIHPLPRFVSCPSFLSPRAPLETGSKVWTHPRYCGWKVMSLSRFPFSRLRARTSMQEHIELGRDGMTILASILTHPSLKIAK